MRRDEACAPAAASLRRRPRIMVVDDDEIMRKLLTRILKAQDYDVVAVADADAALHSLQGALPDLILTDVEMPAVNGLELTRRLKKIEAYAAIPVLIFSGRDELQMSRDCRDAGAADFIVKPFEREVLLQKLRQYVPQKAPPADAAGSCGLPPAPHQL
jgi:CheY-like chemotaxis protein